MAERPGPARRPGLHWPGLVLSLVFLAVASAGFSGDPFWLLNDGTKWMVAAGRMNREIAETLFVSTSTIEAHLTRIYRKLQLRSRTELTTWLQKLG